MELGTGSLSSILNRVERGRMPDFRRVLHGHSAFARRMAVRRVLSAHGGCVNRLALSEDGTLLLSGSDDCTLRIWRLCGDVSECNLKGTVEPGHLSNIFGVSFMPSTGCSYVASAGLDKQVRYTHVESGFSVLWKCHEKTVKSISCIDAHTFVSASRDGTIRLFDVRLRKTCSTPQVIVRIPLGPTGSLPFNSANVSPTCPYHIVAAANDCNIRVFDTRFPTVLKPSASALGHCIETYCPPHLHKSSPEQSAMNDFHQTSSTYANFSHDGQQIVATYYEDCVSVFNRPNYASSSSSVICRRPPFTSRSHCLYAVTKFTNDAARHIVCKRPCPAISSANRALQLDERNLFALVCKADALLTRNQSCDSRNAHSALQSLIDILHQDSSGQSIAYLWSSSDKFGPHGIVLPADSAHERAKSWKLKKEIWIMIFQYLQALSLYCMIPPLFFSMLSPRLEDRMLTMKRLQYLNRICSRLEQYREMKRTSQLQARIDWDDYVRRALGDQDEQDMLYPSSEDKIRRRVLSGLVEKFLKGIDRLRDRLGSSLSWLQPDQNSSDANGSTQLTVAADSCSERSDEDDEDGDDNHDDDGIGHNHEDQVMDYRESSSAAQRVSVQPETRRSLFNLASSTPILEDNEDDLWGPLHRPSNCRSFVGHRSHDTDIKEANFFGSNNQVVLSGSDDGKIFMWSATTSELLGRVKADEQIVNCVMGHPHHSMIIASGIDNTIKLLTP